MRMRAASRSVVARSTLKVFRLRLFTPISSAPAVKRAIQLGFVMHLDQRRQPCLRRQRMEVLQLRIAQDGHNQQDRRPRPTQPPPGFAAHQ